MREELKNGNRSMFSRCLYKAIEDRLQKKEQIVLLLNRRGYATFVMCRTCGFVSQCPHCDISLNLSSNSRMLRCHYCGYAEREVRSVLAVSRSIFVILEQEHSELKRSLVRFFLGFGSSAWM